MMWQIEELGKIGKQRPKRIKKILDQMFNSDPEIKRLVIVNAYLDKKINLSKAAEELGLHRLELEKQFVSKGIPVRRISKADVAAEVKAVSKWK